MSDRVSLRAREQESKKTKKKRKKNQEKTQENDYRRLLLYVICLSQVHFVCEGLNKTLSNQSQRHVCWALQVSNTRLKHKGKERKKA